MIKHCTIIISMVLLLLGSSTTAFALDDGAYIVTVTGYYVNPETGNTSD